MIFAYFNENGLVHSCNFIKHYHCDLIVFS